MKYSDEEVAEMIGIEAAEDLRCLKEMQKYDAFVKKFFIGAWVVVQKEFLINTMIYHPGAVGKVVGRDAEKCIIEFSLTPYIAVNISSYFHFVDEYFVVLAPTWPKEGVADALCDR